MKQIFEKIYAGDAWGGTSGDGSHFPYAAPYADLLQYCLKTWNVTSVVDLGCGDWGFSRHIRWDAIRYLGVDCVEKVIEQNRKSFATDLIQFQTLDAAQDQLPPADLLLVKDVLQHWSNAKVRQLIPTFQRFARVLVTNDLIAAQPRQLNQDIPDGDFRPIDLMAPPFNLPAHEILIYTNASRLPSEPIRWVKKTIVIARNSPAVSAPQSPST